MPSKTDGISPQNKIDNNVSTALNTIVNFIYKIDFLSLP